MVSRRMYEENKREGELAAAQKRYRQQRRAGYKDLHRKWIGMDFTERPRIYKGCENCRHYSGRKCQKTQEELTMVCDEWEGN